MRIIIYMLLWFLPVAAVTGAETIVTGNRIPAMLIEYKARTVKDITLKEMVVTHPTGITRYYTESDVQSWRAAAVATRDDAIAEIERCDQYLNQIKGIK